jgi:hypothetical protein
MAKLRQPVEKQESKVYALFSGDQLIKGYPLLVDNQRLCRSEARQKGFHWGHIIPGCPFFEGFVPEYPGDSSHCSGQALRYPS